MEKIDWDSYFMAMTFMVATRSIDTSTKCGCVVVAPDHSVLSMGYNSPPRGCDDEKVPMTRPEKYAYMAHAEANAIANAAREGIALKGSTFYITGFPCSVCFRSMKNAGAARIVYGPNMAAMHTLEDSQDKDDFAVIEFMNNTKEAPWPYQNRLGHVKSDIEFVEYKGDLTPIFDQAKQNYLNKKEKNG